MKCGACGKPVESAWYARGLLCECCSKKVDAYIESLKPKVVVETEGAGYMVVRPNSHQSMWVAFDQADALYEYMRREREG